MGRPVYPTRAQIAELRQAAELPPPETRIAPAGEADHELPPQGLALIEIRK